MSEAQVGSFVWYDCTMFAAYSTMVNLVLEQRLDCDARCVTRRDCPPPSSARR
jgi:hypothetical protein